MLFFSKFLFVTELVGGYPKFLNWSLSILLKSFIFFVLIKCWAVAESRLALSDVPYVNNFQWRRGVVVVTTGQLHSINLELRFCAGSNLARVVSEIRDGEDLWQCSRLEMRLNAFRQSTIPQKQFFIIIKQK